MSIQVEDPGVWVVYCDSCGERKVLDAEPNNNRAAREELEEADWTAMPPKKVKFANDYTSERKLVIEYHDHFCPDCP